MEALSFLVLQAFLLWLASLRLRDSSLMDRFWGLSFIVVALLIFANADLTTGELVLLGMVSLWGLRLSFHVTRRNWGKGEDPRYQAMRQSTTGYAWTSLMMVFLFQNLLIAIIALPFWSYRLSGEGQTLGCFEGMGLTLWGLGWLIEILADRQLEDFRRGHGRTGKVMNRGLWAMSRHPNYVGEALLWWGFWLYTFSWASSWTLISPVLVTCLLRYFTGVEHLERHMVKTRPAYRSYQRSVPVFWPKPVGRPDSD